MGLEPGIFFILFVLFIIWNIGLTTGVAQNHETIKDLQNEIKNIRYELKCEKQHRQALETFLKVYSYMVPATVTCETYEYKKRPGGKGG